MFDHTGSYSTMFLLCAGLGVLSTLLHLPIRPVRIRISGAGEEEGGSGVRQQLLQAVLGFDNLLYISLESKRAPEALQSSVRKWGIGIAVGLRVVLLFLLIKMISSFQAEWFPISWKGVIEGSFNLHSIIVLVGGVFILYTAM